MLLVVGLGNPGPRYARQRHNVGFVAVERIAACHRFGQFRPAHQGLTSLASVGGRKVLLMKPLTFMNDSGRAVGLAARYFKIDPDRIVIVHDELDLEPGKLRVKAGGGHAGHNGLRSIDAHIGRVYRRVRLGIGHPGRKDRVSRHVLGDFSAADRDWLEPFIDAVADAFPLLVADDPSGFASRVALLAPPPGKTREQG